MTRDLPLAILTAALIALAGLQAVQATRAAALVDRIEAAAQQLEQADGGRLAMIETRLSVIVLRQWLEARQAGALPPLPLVSEGNIMLAARVYETSAPLRALARPTSWRQKGLEADAE